MAIRKNVLITAGSTWVGIDKVRVISNIASGQTGFILANKFNKIGVKVTLLLGPGNSCGSKSPRESRIRIVDFKYFSELERLLKVELAKRKYSVVIHAAAVADYQPQEKIRHKVSSHLDSWKINLVPTRKLVNDLKNYGADLFTVGFKFEPDAEKKQLIEKSRKLLKQANLDLVVANSNKNNVYCAYIVDKVNEYGPFLRKTGMAACLLKLVKKEL